MRMLMTVTLCTKKTNDMIRTGMFESTIKKALAQIKPEAVYFEADDAGNRTVLIFFDMQESSQMPLYAEPWFLAFNAKVTYRPVMNQQDLSAGASGFENNVKEFGKL